MVSKMFAVLGLYEYSIFFSNMRQILYHSTYKKLEFLPYSINRELFKLFKLEGMTG